MNIIENILGFGGHGYLDPSYVVIHETAGPGAPAANIVSWWENGGGLPVHYCGDWTGDCYYCVPEDQVCWQVGNGNDYVVGIELCHATNEADFQAVWELGIEWAAWQLSKRGWGVDRLLSHYECGQIWGGTDHTDPIGYFEEFGRSWEQFKVEVEERLNGEDMPTVNEVVEGIMNHPLANPEGGSNPFWEKVAWSHHYAKKTFEVTEEELKVLKSIDKKLDNIKVGGVDMDALSDAVADKIAKRMKN